MHSKRDEGQKKNGGQDTWFIISLLLVSRLMRWHRCMHAGLLIGSVSAGCTRSAGRLLSQIGGGVSQQQTIAAVSRLFKDKSGA
jgi:hypothetical protein